MKNQESKDVYQAEFGQLILCDGPENNFCWNGIVNHSNNSIFSEEIPIYIITKGKNIPNITIDLVQRIVSNINEYLECAILYTKNILTEERDKYNIQENEYEFLDLDIASFPIGCPEVTFWEDSEEWIIRFAEGKFNICDPLGIGVTFRDNKLISVDNLEDCEFID
jgi:hypothetical protein